MRARVRRNPIVQGFMRWQLYNGTFMKYSIGGQTNTQHYTGRIPIARFLNVYIYTWVEFELEEAERRA